MISTLKASALWCGLISMFPCRTARSAMSPVLLARPQQFRSLRTRGQNLFCCRILDAPKGAPCRICRSPPWSMPCAICSGAMWCLVAIALARKPHARLRQQISAVFAYWKIPAFIRAKRKTTLILPKPLAQMVIFLLVMRFPPPTAPMPLMLALQLFCPLAPGAPWSARLII